MVTQVTPLAERLARKTMQASCGCHVWLGSCDAKFGHGNLYDHAKRRSVKAHRAAYELANGPIADDACVLHRCDVPQCVNPAHLFLGTRADNNADMVSKSRHARAHGDTMRNSALFVATRPRGEANTEAKVTEDEVRAIRRRYAAGGISQQKLGDEYGVSQVAVSFIVLRKTWTHIGEDH